jgi:hypothetical protein
MAPEGRTMATDSTPKDGTQARTVMTVRNNLRAFLRLIAKDIVRHLADVDERDPLQAAKQKVSGQNP